MKCYCLKYDLERQSPKTVFVSKNSSFQIGIRVKRGETYPNCDLYRDGSAVEATGTLGSYTTWSLASGEDENEENLVVKCMGTDLPLKIVTTSSDVAELPADAGGDKPDLSNYYTKKEVDEKVDALDGFIASVNTTAEEAKTTADGLGTRVTAVENAGYQTSSQVDSKVSESLASYSNTEQMNSAISAATDGLAKTSDLASYWNKSTETETHAMTGTYEDGTEFSYTVICRKA